MLGWVDAKMGDCVDVEMGRCRNGLWEDGVMRSWGIALMGDG